MPRDTKNKKNKKNYNRRKGYNSLYGTKPQFMSRRQKQKRAMNQTGDTRYFTSTGIIYADQSGNSSEQFACMRLTAGQFYPNFVDLGDWENYSTFWSQYKFLSIQIKIYSANVGTEGMKGTNGPQGIAQPFGWLRGNSALYTVSQFSRDQIIPTSINEVIGRGSCQMIPSRSEKWTRTIYRPRGYPAYGVCDIAVGQGTTNPWALRTPDLWTGRIFFLGNNATGANPPNAQRPLWYYVMRVKCHFKGRRLSFGQALPIELAIPDPVQQDQIVTEEKALPASTSSINTNNQ